MGLFGCGSYRGAIDEDGDGFTVDQGDCQEGDSSVFPEAPEIWYDGLDQNCDGNDGDQDGDGWYFSEYTFEVPKRFQTGDCQDDPSVADASLIHPLEPDVPYDGIDSDCAGNDDWDADQDGYSVDTDCFDAPNADFENPANLVPADVHPGAVDAPYDGTDADCAGNDDWDADGDGSPISEDCADNDPLRSPSLEEIWYDGTDQNCDGNDGDQDQDGWYASKYSGEVPDGYAIGDCDDTVATVFPGASDIPYDGVDADCAGNDDFDADGDGWERDRDCDDLEVSVHPGQSESCNAKDDDCSGVIDDDAFCPCPVHYRGSQPYLACATGDYSFISGFCPAFGYEPVVLQDQSEADWLVGEGLSGWLAVDDQLVEGSFLDYNGNIPAYTNWETGEPDNAGGREDCVYFAPDGSWEDVDCSLVLTVLCEG